MKNVKDAMTVYEELNINDRMAFYITLSSQIDLKQESFQELLMETRFDKGIICPHCGSNRSVKNGRRPDGVQRYLCRDCRKSFLASTDSFVSGTHKSIHIWKKYLNCMLDRNTLKESSEKCGISMGTAFQWRHKILDALQKTEQGICLSGTVEADETYVAVSFKGNHSRSHTFSMPRAAHERGGSIHTQGLSNEQVCIPCAVNRSGIPVSGVGKLGKVSSACVERLFKDRLQPDTVLCTDHERAYFRLAAGSGLKLVQMDTDCRLSGRYGIQRINAYHSKLKNFLRQRRGVSTKYLGNYLVWHNLMFCSSRGREELERALMGTALAARIRVRCRELSHRAPVPVGV